MVRFLDIPWFYALIFFLAFSMYAYFCGLWVLFNRKIKNMCDWKKTACCDVITGTRKNKPVPDQNKQVINHNTFLPMRENRVEVINNVPISLRFHQHARFAF